MSSNSEIEEFGESEQIQMDHESGEQQMSEPYEDSEGLESEEES